MSTTVELLKRTPFGGPGDIVSIPDDMFEAYSDDVLVKTDKPLSNGNEDEGQEYPNKALTDVKNTAMKTKGKK